MNNNIDFPLIFSTIKDCVEGKCSEDRLKVVLDNICQDEGKKRHIYGIYPTQEPKEKHNNILSYFLRLVSSKVLNEKSNLDYLNLFKILISYGADLNQLFPEGVYTITYAAGIAAGGKSEILEFILANYKVDLNAAQVLLLPVSAVLDNGIKIDNAIKTMELLIKNGADVNKPICNKQGEEVSLLAMLILQYKDSNLPIIELLLRNGADVFKKLNTKNGDYDAFIIALGLENPKEIIDLFVKYGLDLDKDYDFNDRRYSARQLIERLNQPKSQNTDNYKYMLRAMATASVAALPAIVFPILLKKFPITENEWGKIINIALPSFASAIFACVTSLILNQDPDNRRGSLVNASLILCSTALIEGSKMILIESLVQERFNTAITVSAALLNLLVDFVIIHFNDNKGRLI